MNDKQKTFDDGSLTPEQEAQMEQERGGSSETDAAAALTRSMEERTVTYEHFGTGKERSLTYDEVYYHIAKPTKKGVYPEPSDIRRFLKLCQARGLDPYLHEAYLIGYDDKTRGPIFDCRVAHTALDQRAEAHPEYRGKESGIIVRDKKSGAIQDIAGCFYDDKSHELVGGWCKIKRNDRDVAEYTRLRIQARRGPSHFWSDQPEFMICKCAEADCYRKAFPRQLGGMHTNEEMPSDEVERLPTTGNQSDASSAEAVASL